MVQRGKVYAYECMMFRVKIGGRLCRDGRMKHEVYMGWGRDRYGAGI